MIEQEIYQMAYNWAIHDWYKASRKLDKHPDSNCLKDEEHDTWEKVKAIEKIAEEKGYNWW